MSGYGVLSTHNLPCGLTGGTISNQQSMAVSIIPPYVLSFPGSIYAVISQPSGIISFCYSEWAEQEQIITSAHKEKDVEFGSFSCSPCEEFIINLLTLLPITAWQQSHCAWLLGLCKSHFCLPFISIIKYFGKDKEKEWIHGFWNLGIRIWFLGIFFDIVIHHRQIW